PEAPRAARREGLRRPRPALVRPHLPGPDRARRRHRSATRGSGREALRGFPDAAPPAPRRETEARQGGPGAPAEAPRGALKHGTAALHRALERAPGGGAGARRLRRLADFPERTPPPFPVDAG